MPTPKLTLDITSWKQGIIFMKELKTFMDEIGIWEIGGNKKKLISGKIHDYNKLNIK